MGAHDFVTELFFGKSVLRDSVRIFFRQHLSVCSSAFSISTSVSFREERIEKEKEEGGREGEKNCRLATHPCDMICIISWLANEGTSSNVDICIWFIHIKH